jgi:H-type small acid-soluble spore protein
MNRQRASEIMNSKGVINVCYNGMPVWLEGIHGDDAEISFIGLDNKSSVPLSGLVETEALHGL